MAKEGSGAARVGYAVGPSSRFLAACETRCALAVTQLLWVEGGSFRLGSLASVSLTATRLSCVVSPYWGALNVELFS